MSSNDARLDAQLRSLLGTLDARPGFEARVAARLAAHAVCTASCADLRAGLEHRRELERRRLAREAWSRGLTTAGLGMAASALVWHYAADIARWQPAQFSTTLSTAVLLVVLWPWMRRLPMLRDL